MGNKKLGSSGKDVLEIVSEIFGETNDVSNLKKNSNGIITKEVIVNCEIVSWTRGGVTTVLSRIEDDVFLEVSSFFSNDNDGGEDRKRIIEDGKLIVDASKVSKSLNELRGAILRSLE